jgi:hypothetical protein
MASGINTTFRQVGVATGIAVFGTLFATRLANDIVGGLRGTPLADRAHAVATAVTQGQGQGAFGALPPAARHTVGQVVRTAFVSGLNEILVVSGVGALVAAVAAFILIRGQDFVARTPPPPPASQAAGQPAVSSADAALPVSAGDARGPARLVQPVLSLGLGVPGLLPVPLAAAAWFCDWAVVSWTGAEPRPAWPAPAGRP